MRSNYLFKTIPFFTTLIIIAVLSFYNQKQTTRLKLLIWQSPNLSLGTYIAISTSSGFALSYLINYSLSRHRQPRLKRKDKYNLEPKEEFSYDIQHSYDIPSYDNTLIERDINEPLPTINANFRVIGKNSDLKKTYSENKQYGEYTKEVTNDYNENDNEELNDKFDTKINSLKNDWEDESYRNW